MFKRCKVVMLPTNKKSPVSFVFNTAYKKILSFKDSFSDNITFGEYVHLYILSDEKIEEGDWVITTISELDIYNQIEIFENKCDSMYCKKIIATTNNSLMENYELMSKSGLAQIQRILPQPSQSFIEKYVAEYNKGDIITDVLVEYIYDAKDFPAKIIDIPKVSKDNTITIKKVKDNWSRGEVLKLTKIAALVAFVHPEVFAEGIIFDDNKFNKWVEEIL